MATITDFQSNKSIFIPNIPLKTQENDLYKFITEQLKNVSGYSGKYTNVIESLHINKKDLYDYAIGFVTMRTHEDAKNAIKLLNGKKMSEQSSPLSVMWNVSKRKERLVEEGTVFVRGIKKDVKVNDIKELFERYGKTLLVKLSTSENNESNGYAYVRFVEANNAERVLSPFVINRIKYEIGDENFKIEKCNKPQKQEKRNIYIENIDISCSEEEIIYYFKQFGEIDVLLGDSALCVKIVLDEVHNKKKAYVMYKNHEDALRAIQNTHEKKIEILSDSVLRTCFYKSKSELKKERKREREIKKNVRTKYKDSNICLTSEDTELTVKDIIDKLGDGKEDIFYNIRVEVVPEQHVKTAFVCFYKVEDAQLAIKKCEKQNNGWKAVPFRPRTQQPQQQNQFYPNFMTYYNMMMMSSMPMQQFPVFQQMPYAGPQQQPFDLSPPNKPKQGNQKKPIIPIKPKQEPKQQQQEPEQINDEELINVIGNQIYDYVEKLGKYDEDLIARITGVFLESFDIKELEGKLKNPEKELSPIIDEIADTLKNMALDE
ncbi:Polyadenylate-binding protein [Entamoeba marina]